MSNRPIQVEVTLYLGQNRYRKPRCRIGLLQSINVRLYGATSGLHSEAEMSNRPIAINQCTFIWRHFRSSLRIASNPFRDELVALRGRLNYERRPLGRQGSCRRSPFQFTAIPSTESASLYCN